MSSGARVLCLKCKTIIQSNHRHDFVQCKCGAVFVDGGGDYLRIGGDQNDWRVLKDNDCPNDPVSLRKVMVNDKKRTKRK